MRLVMLGGGGFRTPLVYAALAATGAGVTDVVLQDTDPDRLRRDGPRAGPGCRRVAGDARPG